MLVADLTPYAFAPGLVVAGPVAYAGIGLHATGTNPKVRVWDNAGAASGTLLGTYELTTSGVGSWLDLVFAPPKRALLGIFVELVTGTVEGSILVA